MAGPPVKRRTAKSYARDMESFNRLKMAILQDDALEWNARKDVCDKIDAVIVALVPLLPKSSRSMKAAERVSGGTLDGNHN